MADQSKTPLRDRYAAIDARLSGAGAVAERDAIKSEIIALYRQVEQELAQLAALKDDIKGLIERWKAVRQSAGVPPTAPPLSHRPAVHADHIGASTFLEKGWSLISLGDPAAAEEALLRALELSPDDPDTESLLGWARMLQEHHDEALLNFQRVLARQPANALARINLGYICLKKGIFGEAIEHLSKAIRLDSDRKATLYAHFYLGLVYLEREMYEDAQSFFRKALAVGPNMIEAYYELGRALWLDGRREEARAAWRDGAAANRSAPWGRRCAERLAEVDGEEAATGDAA